MIGSEGFRYWEGFLGTVVLLYVIKITGVCVTRQLGYYWGYS